MVTAVTTPKPPLPPRNAQNRSGCCLAVAERRTPSAQTILNDSTWSEVNPKVRAIGPRPPPSSNPPTPTPGADPHNGASPCGEPDGRDHVFGVGGADNHCRSVHICQIEPGGRRGVTVITRFQHLTAEHSPQGGQRISCTTRRVGCSPRFRCRLGKVRHW